jgi:hypothetical protein
VAGVSSGIAICLVPPFLSVIARASPQLSSRSGQIGTLHQMAIVIGLFTAQAAGMIFTGAVSRYPPLGCELTTRKVIFRVTGATSSHCRGSSPAYRLLPQATSSSPVHHPRSHPYLTSTTTSRVFLPCPTEMRASCCCDNRLNPADAS